jgi:hypothetical protein
VIGYFHKARCNFVYPESERWKQAVQTDASPNLKEGRMVLTYCQSRHRCPEGGEGECSQVQGHFGKHLCKRCFSFFVDRAQRQPEDASFRENLPASSGPSGPMQELLRRQATPADPGVRQPQPPPGEAKTPPVDQSQIPGIWSSQVQTAYGPMRTVLVLDLTKKFSQQSTLGYLMTYDVGTYEVGDGYIHFVVQDHEPKVYNGQPMTWLKSWTYLYTVTDANTMIFEDRVAQSRWTVHRESAG